MMMETTQSALPTPARSRARSGRLQRLLRSGLIYAVLVITTVVAVAPILWMLSSSLKSYSEFSLNPWLWPRDWQWANYLEVWKNANFSLYFLNSLIMVGGSVSLMIFMGSMAGYALARYKFRARDSVLYYFVSGQIVPGQVVLVPLFIIIRFLGMLNTRQGLMLVYLAAAMPFVVFMMQGFFRTIPVELEESARIDGAGEFRIFWQIMLPLVSPAIGTLAIFQGMFVWNDFLFALLFASKPELRTLPIGIFSVIGQYFTNYPVYFAGLSVATLPIVIFYVICAKYLVRGGLAGAVKG